VGNLEAVNEEVYRDCYLPLVETIASYSTLAANLHLSGSLLDWLAVRHPEYLDRVRALVTAGRVELLGGAYHDPILPMLSRADRRGQIESFGRRLGQLFGSVPRGMWLPERIWEPALAADLAECGIEHTVLDDFHFHAAGLSNEQLRGYFLTEAEGRLIALFAGDERLRYLIPFGTPEETIDYLREVSRKSPDGLIVYADDAEKFGAWPGMQARMQKDRWLARFLDALVAAADWLHVTTLGQSIDHVPPLGKIYVPEGSYREMHGWSTYAGAPQTNDDRSTATHPGKGLGTWRNFRVKYSEADEMYCRMLMVSRRCEAAAGQADDSGLSDADGSPRVLPHPALAASTRHSGGPENEPLSADLLVSQARQALYRAQCGCAYWHGIYGGVYLPHLRQAVYRNLIEAETLLDAAAAHAAPLVSAAIDDFNLDVHKEIFLTTSTLALLVAPERGGQLYELDVRAAAVNLLATMTRRPEPYHTMIQKAEDPPVDGGPEVPVPAVPVCDRYPRKSLLDHFFDPRTTFAKIVSGAAVEHGDFVTGRYQARLRRVRSGISLQLSRAGSAWGRPVKISKQIMVWAEQPAIDIHYELAGLPPGQPIHFAVEFNFAGMPPGCPNRYFVDCQGRDLADFGEPLDMTRTDSLRLVDRAIGLDVGLSASRPGGIWAFPIRTISRAQHGLETIQQSVAVLPHWMVVGDDAGRWTVDLRLAIVASPAAGPATAWDAAAAGSSVATELAGAIKSAQFLVDGPHSRLAPKGIGTERGRRHESAGSGGLPHV
jgi:alpha-amylase